MAKLKTLEQNGEKIYPRTTSDAVFENDSKQFVSKDDKTSWDNAGYSIDMSMDSNTYVVTLYLKNKVGTTISTKSIDLPLESVVVSGAYLNTTKEVQLSLQGGTTIKFSVADLIGGLQSEITVNNKLPYSLIDGAPTITFSDGVLTITH